MTYQDREISRNELEKHLKALDSDEGIRIESGDELVFVNRTSNRYCIDISKAGHDEFYYTSDSVEALEFLLKKIGPTSRIFFY